MRFSERDNTRSKKWISIAVVVFIHIVIFYLLANGLGKQIITVIKELPIEAQLISEVKPADPLPSRPPSAIQPKLSVPIPVQSNVTAQAIEAPPPMPQEKPSAPVESVAVATAPVITQAVVDFSTCEKPAYPRNALRNEEQGTVRLQFLIGLDGHVADSKIDKSSGSRTLDAAAKKALSLCRFKPGTVDGKPQQSWTTVEYVWRLPD